MKNFIQKNTSKTILFVLLVLVTEVYAETTRNSVKMLEASEDIKFISQQISKEYFYLSQNKEKQSILASSLDQTVSTLDEKLRLIATITKSEDTRNLLNFLVYSSEHISETITEPYNIENAAMMLDYSEILLEGAESIAHEYSYVFSKEEQMLISVKNMAYLLERMTKYYMAFQAGFTDLNNVRQLKLAIVVFDEELLKLNEYNYPAINREDLQVINQYWPIAKNFYLSLEKRKLPNILYMSADHLENMIAKLKLFHSKNQ